MVFELQASVMLLVMFVLLAVKIFAFVNALLYSNESYVAAGKLTKPAWSLILGLGVVIQLRDRLGDPQHRVHDRRVRLPRRRTPRAGRSVPAALITQLDRALFGVRSLTVCTP